jgi:TP901 family phage tail tape measure protein
MAQQKLGIEITGNAQGLTNAISTAEGKLKSFGSKLQSVGGNLTQSLTLPLVAIGGAATKMAFDFDKSMTMIKSLVGVAGDEVDAMGETAKQMALDTGKSASEAAEALFFITSAGLRGDEAMQTLEASLKAAAVGLGETKTIADLATSAMNAYGSDTLGASDATDILTAAVREGKLEASQLAGAMGGVIPIASNMGVRFDEVAAAMAAMSRTGTDAANGATQLNAILASIKKPTTQAEEALGLMGLSFADVQKSLTEKGLIATLEQLQQGLAQTGQDASAIFPNIRALKGFLDLTGAGLETNKQIFDSLTESMGATNQAFEVTAESASFKMTKSLNEMKGSLLEVGSVLLEMLVPVVTKLGNFLREASDSFKNLDDGTKRFIITIGSVAAVVGPALIVIGKISTTLGFLSKSLPLLTTNWNFLVRRLWQIQLLQLLLRCLH